MINIYDYSNIREYLKDLYEHKKRENTNFSHRYIGMKVGFSAGYFSRILKGEKMLSSEMAEKFIHFLSLSANEGDYFRTMVNYTQTKESDGKNLHYKQLLSLRKRRDISKEKQGYRLFSNWANSVVFSLCRIMRITDSSDFAKLGKNVSPKLSAKEIRDSLSLLEKMNIIEKNERGEYQVIDSFLSSIGDESIHVQNYLLNSMKSAEYALENLAREEREISTMMLTLSEDGYQKIKNRIIQMRQEINEIVAQDEGVDRICQANFHLFPLFQK